MTSESRTPTAIVRVHRPELSKEERARRMKNIEQAAIRLVLSAARREDHGQQEMQEMSV